MWSGSLGSGPAPPVSLRGHCGAGVVAILPAPRADWACDDLGIGDGVVTILGPAPPADRDPLLCWFLMDSREAWMSAMASE